MRKLLSFYDFLNESEKSQKKKVLFISFTDKTRGVSYHDYLKSKLDADFCLWTDLVFDDDEISFNGNQLKDYGFIFIGVVSKHPDYFVSVEQYAKTHGIPTFKYGCSPERNNKMFQNRILSTNNLNPVPTIIAKCSEIETDHLIKEFGLPVVAKIPYPNICADDDTVPLGIVLPLASGITTPNVVPFPFVNVRVLPLNEAVVNPKLADANKEDVAEFKLLTEVFKL